MVAGGEHVGAKVEQLFGDLRRYAETASGILRIDDGEFDVMRGAHVADVLAHDAAPRAAENVADEKNFQKTAPSVAIIRSSTETEKAEKQILRSPPPNLPQRARSLFWAPGTFGDPFAQNDISMMGRESE